MVRVRVMVRVIATFMVMVMVMVKVIVRAKVRVSVKVYHSQESFGVRSSVRVPGVEPHAITDGGDLGHS